MIPLLQCMTCLVAMGAVIPVTVVIAGMVVKGAAIEAEMGALKMTPHTWELVLGNTTDGATTTSMLKTRSTRGSGNAKKVAVLSC